MISPSDRKKAEAYWYHILDTIDPSGTNTDYYKKLFNDMSDKQFEELFKKKFPLKVFVRHFEVEPKMEDILKALKFMGVPALEKINEPHNFIDENGNPVKTKEAIVGYIHMRKEEQIETKKNSMSINTDRDINTGQLIKDSKNARTTDRENDSMAVFDTLKYTQEELNGPRADNLEAEIEMMNEISKKGYVSLKELDIDPENSIALNLLNTYLIGAHLNTNIMNKGNILPYTLKKEDK